MVAGAEAQGRALAPDVAVLVPAWQPDDALCILVTGLLDAGAGAIIIVDDGSDAAHQEPFAIAAAHERVHVLRHAVNQGKGRALKTGINAFLQLFPHFRGLATADADGQHTVPDIVRAVAAFDAAPTRVVLGARALRGAVPLRSRLGNALTRRVFALLTGAVVSDTQSGLRVFPAALLPELLGIEGERYEYEMGVLAHVCRRRRPLEIPIATLYLDANASSHFNPVLDSLRIYFVLARFYASSLLAAALDTAVFALAYALGAGVFWSMVAGRSSSLVNFALNRGFVFHSGAALAPALVRYYLLAAAIAVGAYAGIQALTAGLGWNVLPAKVMVETLLSLVSFSVQRTFVFARPDDAP